MYIVVAVGSATATAGKESPSSVFGMGTGKISEDAGGATIASSNIVILGAATSTTDSDSFSDGRTSEGAGGV